MYISQSERDNLDKGLGLFIKVFRPYIVSILIKRFGENWEKGFAETLKPRQRENWENDLRKGINSADLIDFQYLKNIALYNKDLLEEDFGYEKHSLPTWLGEIYDARSPIAHYTDTLEETKALKAWIHLREIAKLIGNNQLEQELSTLQRKQKIETPEIQPPKILEVSRPNLIQHSTETLDIVNCSKSWEEVLAEEVYICLPNNAFAHQQCKYIGIYSQKRVRAVGEIEAVIDVYSFNKNEVYFINGNESVENYNLRAREKSLKLRLSLPQRVFLLKDLYLTDFIKDSVGAMRANKIYIDVENLSVKNAMELAEALDGRAWSEFGN